MIYKPNTEFTDDMACILQDYLTRILSHKYKYEFTYGSRRKNGQYPIYVSYKMIEKQPFLSFSISECDVKYEEISGCESSEIKYNCGLIIEYDSEIIHENELTKIIMDKCSNHFENLTFINTNGEIEVFR